MPKMKSNRAAAKRFRRTGTGKIRRRKAYASHLLTGKRAKRKRKLRRGTLVGPTDHRRMERLLG